MHASAACKMWPRTAQNPQYSDPVTYNRGRPYLFSGRTPGRERCSMAQAALCQWPDAFAALASRKPDRSLTVLLETISARRLPHVGTGMSHSTSSASLLRPRPPRAAGTFLASGGAVRQLVCLAPFAHDEPGQWRTACDIEGPRVEAGRRNR